MSAVEGPPPSDMTRPLANVKNCRAIADRAERTLGASKFVRLLVSTIRDLTNEVVRLRRLAQIEKDSKGE